MVVVAASLVASPSGATQGGAGPAGVPGEMQPAAPVPVAGGDSAGTAGAQSQTEVREIDVPDAATTRRERRSPGREVVARLHRRGTGEFALVALTWRLGTAPADAVIQIRTHGERGWSTWQELHHHPAEGPAPAEESGERAGTEPLWVDEADGVQARVLSATGTAPRDVEVTMVDPGQSGGGSAVTPAVLTGAAASAETTTVASRWPRMVSRRQWGADPSLKSPCSPPRRARTVQMAFVHHTAGSNYYTRSEAPAIVRSIYAYHTQGRGWCDIGYNFLVDRYGVIYVGRAGGPNTPVRGAHAGYYNEKSSGVSLIGNFEERRPTRAMKRGLTRVLSWKLGSYYRRPRTSVRLEGERFEKISGHRDAMSTACPGRYVYNWLPRLRDRVANRIDGVRTPISRKWRALRRDGARVGQPFRGEHNASNGGRRTQFSRGWIWWNDRTGAHRVHGAILRRYRSYGQARGRLGYPRSDRWRIREHRGRGQTFQHGRIYRTPRHGTGVVWGKVDRRFRRTGSAAGRLGVPVRSQFRYRRGWVGAFEHGCIYWNTRKGRTWVRYY